MAQTLALARTMRVVAALEVMSVATQQMHVTRVAWSAAAVAVAVETTARESVKRVAVLWVALVLLAVMLVRLLLVAAAAVLVLLVQAAAQIPEALVALA